MTYPSGSNPADTLCEPRTRYTTEERAVARRFGPDPSKCFYRLHELLLWCPDLKPISKLLLIDFFHHADKGQVVPSIRVRAERMGVSVDTVERAEDDLIEGGYLLRLLKSGKVSLYLGAFPPHPKSPAGKRDTEDRKAFEASLQDLSESLRDPPQNADTHSAKCGYYPPQNADTKPAPSTKDSYKKEKEGNIGEPDGCARPQRLRSDWQEWWERFQTTYPARRGDRCRPQGIAKFQARLKAGVTPEEILAGCQRYRAFCDATGKTGTEFVQQYPTWLNREGWREEWSFGEDVAAEAPTDERQAFYARKGMAVRPPAAPVDPAKLARDMAELRAARSGKVEAREQR